MSGGSDLSGSEDNQLLVNLYGPLCSGPGEAAMAGVVNRRDGAVAVTNADVGATVRRSPPGALTVLRRVPFTASVLAVIVVASIVTGGAWSAVAGRGWHPQVAYGLPALEAGQIWTVVVGPFLAVDPASYVPVLLSFAAFVGYAEWRLGTARAAAVTVGGQIVVVVLSALVLSLLRGVGWD